MVTYNKIPAKSRKPARCKYFIHSPESRNCFTGLAGTIYKSYNVSVAGRVPAENLQLDCRFSSHRPLENRELYLDRVSIPPDRSNRFVDLGIESFLQKPFFDATCNLSSTLSRHDPRVSRKWSVFARPSPKYFWR